MIEPRFTIPELAQMFRLTASEISQLEGWVENHRLLMVEEDGRLRLGTAYLALHRIAQAERLAQLAAAVRGA